MNLTFWSDGMKWHVLLYARAALVTPGASAHWGCIRMQEILKLIHGGSYLFRRHFLGDRWGWWHGRERRGWSKRWGHHGFGRRFLCLSKVVKVSQLFQKLATLFGGWRIASVNHYVDHKERDNSCTLSCKLLDANSKALTLSRKAIDDAATVAAVAPQWTGCGDQMPSNSNWDKRNERSEMSHEL